MDLVVARKSCTDQVYLWIQERVAKNERKIVAVGTKQNVACVCWRAFCRRTNVEVAHMFDATEQVGLGLGWCVMTSLKLHTCLMLRNRWGWGGV